MRNSIFRKASLLTAQLLHALLTLKNKLLTLQYIDFFANFLTAIILYNDEQYIIISEFSIANYIFVALSVRNRLQ